MTQAVTVRTKVPCRATDEGLVTEDGSHGHDKGLCRRYVATTNKNPKKCRSPHRPRKNAISRARLVAEYVVGRGCRNAKPEKQRPAAPLGLRTIVSRLQPAGQGCARRNLASARCPRVGMVRRAPGRPRRPPDPHARCAPGCDHGRSSHHPGVHMVAPPRALGRRTHIDCRGRSRRCAGNDVRITLSRSGPTPTPAAWRRTPTPGRARPGARPRAEKAGDRPQEERGRSGYIPRSSPGPRTGTFPCRLAR